MPEGWCGQCKAEKVDQELEHGLRVGNTIYPKRSAMEVRQGGYADPSTGRWVRPEPAPDRPMDAALEHLAILADYPIGHPIRQEMNHLVSRMALLEGKIETAASTLAEGIAEMAVTSEPEHPSMSKALEILKR